MGRVCNAGAFLDQLQVLQTLYFNSFHSCLHPTLVLVAVSLEPALLQISTAGVAQQVAWQSGKLKMIWRTFYLLSRYVLCH